DPAEASGVLAAARDMPGVRPVGAMTHFATADEADDDGFFTGQLRLFARWAREAKAAQPNLVLHAANSAAVLRDPDAHFDMVRCGIAIYGMDPFGEDPSARALEPALELSSYVAEVKRALTRRVGRVYHRDGEPIEAPVGEAQLRAALHAAPLAGPDGEDASEAAGLPRDAGPA